MLCLQDGMTAFDAACKAGELERVQAWIAAGVDVCKRMEVRISLLWPLSWRGSLTEGVIYAVTL